MNRIAYFISPHGFGHAARAAAVMAAIQAQDPTAHFEIFTLVPEWFFQDSSINSFNYHPVLTDIGLVQKDSLQEDLPATVARLDEYLPFNPGFVSDLARQVEASGCEGVLCDISPLGITVAWHAGLPSVLTENFTWDWIYQGYLDLAPGLRRHGAYLDSVFESADFHIQTEPVCRRTHADLTTHPVSRQPRSSRTLVRQQLNIPDDEPAVLISMGGIPGQYSFMGGLAHHPGAYFIVPGSSETLVREGNVVRLAHHSGIYHPDLIQAVDAVVGKLGYSTVAEVYAAGLPLGYVPRARFRESETLSAFADAHMKGFEIGQEEFESGRWIKRVGELLSLPRVTRAEPNGAVEIADFVRQLNV